MPYAGYARSAEKLGANVAGDFILKSGIPTCGANQSLNFNSPLGTFTCVSIAVSGGTLTEVTSTNADISIGGTAAAATLTLNSGTGNNQILKLDASAKIPAVDGSLLTNLNPMKVNGQPFTFSSLSANQFLKYNGSAWVNSSIATGDVTGLSSYALLTSLSSAVGCSSAQTVYWNTVSNSLACQNIEIPGSQVSGNIDGTAVGVSGHLSGDVTGGQGATNMVAIRNRALASTAPEVDQVLLWNGSSWGPADIPASAVSVFDTVDASGGVRPGSKADVTDCGLGKANGEGTLRYNYTDHLMEYCNGTSWIGMARILPDPQTVTITASGAWVKPEGVTRVRIQAVGGGGSGDNYNGSGYKGAPGTYIDTGIEAYPAASETFTITIGAAGLDTNPGWSGGGIGGATLITKTTSGNVTAAGGVASSSTYGAVARNTYTLSLFPFGAGAYGRGGGGEPIDNGSGPWNATAGAVVITYQ